MGGSDESCWEQYLRKCRQPQNGSNTEDNTDAAKPTLSCLPNYFVRGATLTQVRQSKQAHFCSRGLPPRNVFVELWTACSKAVFSFSFSSVSEAPVVRVFRTQLIPPPPPAEQRD